MSVSLRAEGLTRRFGSFTAVGNVGLEVETGEIRALIGPNGAGKSTLLNLLAGTLRPDSGRVLLGSRDITRFPVHRRARLGVARSFQVVKLFTELTCRQVLQLAVQRDLSLGAWLGATGRAGVAERVESTLRATGLEQVGDVESCRISHGLQKHLELALALLNDPSVLLLDEPMAGMSTAERVRLREHLRQLAVTRIVVFVEHDLEMVMSLADSVTVMHNGSVIAEGTPEEVRQSAAAQQAYLGVAH